MKRINIKKKELTVIRKLDEIALSLGGEIITVLCEGDRKIWFTLKRGDRNFSLKFIFDFNNEQDIVERWTIVKDGASLDSSAIKNKKTVRHFFAT